MEAEALADRTYLRIDVDRARDLLAHRKMLVLDVRDPKSYAAAHIDSAMHVTSANLDPLILRTPRNTPILIYCYHGNASRSYAQIFSDFGFREIYSLDGGYEAWRSAQASSQDALRAWLRQHGFTDGNIDGVIDHRVTPLMRASRAGNKEAVAALIRAGANVHARNADGNNALWHACIDGSVPIVEALIAAGIDVDNQNCYGATCLMCAALRSKASLVARLLAAGASVAPRTRDGLTAIDMATTIECGELLRAALHGAMSQIRQIPGSLS